MKNLNSLLIMALLWTGWCGLHSLLIAKGVTAWMQARLKERFALYRLAYVLVSIVTVLPVVVTPVRPS